MKKVVIIIWTICSFLILKAEKEKSVPGPYAWHITQPLGNIVPAPMDTLMLNYYQTDIPNARSVAYSTTGNLGGAGQSKIFFERPVTSEFFFKDPYSQWINTASNWTFYNSRIPMTLLSYGSGGSKKNAIDHLKAVFSGNATKQLEFGGGVDYILSRGHYQQQASKDFSYRLFGSYISDKYQLQAFVNVYNFVNQVNGGITNDDYILRPEELQGGQTKIDTKTIPINLTDAYSRIRGQEYYATQRYNLGYYKETKKDTSIIETFIPVTSFIHTIEYNENKHRFVNNSITNDTTYFANTYLSNQGTNEINSWWSLRNTFGISLLEGFNKWAKMGLAAYATYEIRRFTQIGDTLTPGVVPDGCDPLPEFSNPPHHTDNLLWLGGEISKRQGKILTYNVNAKFGLLGSAIGDIDITGNIRSRFPLFKDTVQIRAYGFFRNTEVPYFYKHYTSNHFIWDNDFGKIRRFRVGGEFHIERWRTHLNIGVENLQNYVYFDKDALPRQESSIIQVFNATLKQDFKFGIFNLDNEITYQKSSKSSVIPLPELSVYSNMYLLFRIAKVLHVQLGVDCRYYTKYKSETFQPATLVFHNQDEIEVGNYPFMNAYVNMKLQKTRFYVLFSHANKGIFGGNNYFSMPHYPLNPSIFQLGLSIDFAN